MRNSNPEKLIVNGMTGMGLVWFLVLAALTVVFIVLSVQISGWFVIGAIIFGGYAILAGIWTLIVRAISKEI